MKDFLAEAQNKWNLKVSKIRYDYGREHKNKHVNNWAKKKRNHHGLYHSIYSATNGKAERWNRTLTEKVKVLRYDSKLH